MYEFNVNRCDLCPRECGADRESGAGYCGAGSEIKVARAAPHYWEEPCISGVNGSGTIFFSGCALGCVFCQNKNISHRCEGAAIGADRLCDICFELKEKGVHNISLVTADHFAPMFARELRAIKGELGLPIVFNCSGYISENLLEMLDGIVDIYLDDIKFCSPELSSAMANAPDYFERAIKGLDIMLDQCGKPLIADGIMKRGVIVRHLVLPGSRKDSIEIIRRLAERYPRDSFLFSLMSQYTPNGEPGAPSRRLTSFEYDSVCAALESAGFDGYTQERESAESVYTPPFDLSGVLPGQS